MTGDAQLELAVLSSLRLAGVAAAAELSERTGAPAADVEAELGDLAERRLVRERTGRLSGWQLTPAGTAHGEALLAAQLDGAGRRPVVERAYHDFLALNRRMLGLMTSWQLRPVDGRMVTNDHGDAAYDRDVLAELRSVHVELEPVLDTLEGALDRFATYRTRLARAWHEVDAGHLDHVDRPGIDSIHGVWFELHEDLLATLGLDRATETARLVQGDPPPPGRGG